MNVPVYSKPGCQQCKFTCRSLDRAGIRYSVVDLTTNAAALKYVKDLGYSQAPVVIVNEHHHWSGFNPTEIERLRLSLRKSPNC
jgi:glutaredoxin-like protein NrdH